MIILGIDPGTTSCGYALIHAKQTPQLITAGVIPVTARGTAERLAELAYGIQRIIEIHHPQRVAIERLFFTKNIKTALSVAEARGALLLITALAGLDVYEYTPLEVKKIVTGDGNADKIQVKKMVQMTLPETRTLVARDDVFDAIAIALTCHYKEKVERKYSNE